MKHEKWSLERAYELTDVRPSKHLKGKVHFLRRDKLRIRLLGFLHDHATLRDLKSFTDKILKAKHKKTR